MFRSLVPLFTILFLYIYKRTLTTRPILLSLLPIMLGVVFSTIGEYNFSLMGLLLTFLGTILAALKGIVTNEMLIGRLKLHPLDLLLRMSPLAFIQTMLYSIYLGEFSTFARLDLSAWQAYQITVNGAIAFGLSVASFTANKRTSPITMAVAGNLKQVLTVTSSIFIFSLKMTDLNIAGLILGVVGGMIYTKCSMDANIQQLKDSRIPRNAFGRNSNGEKALV
jgi:hypothetical protein